MHKIYGLFDPRGWKKPKIRYVGKTRAILSSRLGGHCLDTTRRDLGNWIWDLRQLGLVPSIALLEEVEDDWADHAERKWINTFPKGQLFNRRGLKGAYRSLPEPVIGRIRKMEVDLIRTVLAECGGNKSQAARVLGIGRVTLYSKMNLHKIQM